VNDKCLQFITKTTDDDQNPTEHYWSIGGVNYFTPTGKPIVSFICNSEYYPITHPLPDPTTIRRWYSTTKDVSYEMINPPDGKQIIYRGSC
jgi:hypothetical protein